MTEKKYELRGVEEVPGFSISERKADLNRSQAAGSFRSGVVRRIDVNLFVERLKDIWKCFVIS